MCFRPTTAFRKKEIACPKCKKMNPLPLTIESSVSELVRNERAKAILDEHCSSLTNDPRFKQAMGMTLKQIVPLSQGKLTSTMIELVAGDLANLPQTKECRFCGESLPQTQGSSGPAGPAKK